MEKFEREETEKFLENFDTIFNTNLKDNFNVDKLILFFTVLENSYEKITTPNDEYLKLQKEKMAVQENLKKNLSVEQKNDFKKYCELEFKTAELYRKQLMIFEYIFIS